MENKASAYSLLHILEYSAAKAREDIERQYIDNIKTYFNENGTPKTITVNNDSDTITVPEMCITNLKPINVKSVNISFSCCIEKINGDDLILSLEKNDNKEKVSVSIVLDTEETPEGVMRINDRLISEYIEA
ncbi:MAG: DUF2589 domain-containing protein [Eubacterium sp.]|nr:DUF2589 domain-containing protein [Eubacterium sp.]